MKKLLIIGGVAAGATAAARARRLENDLDITILEAGPDVSFANCGLPYYISGEIDSRSKLILQSPESFKSQYNVQVETETEALSIDRKARTVKTLHRPSGVSKDYSYDALILAQGGKPLVPPIPGVKLPHVFSLWTLSDMDKIHDYIETQAPESAVVVGGGFIGLEMAEALRKRGLAVRIVERMPHVMPNMEAEIAGFLQEELISYGVEIYSSKAVTEITERKVYLDDRTSIDADLVLMSVGVKPTLELVRDSGLAMGEAGGLLVNEYLQTSDEHIFAAGDMVELEHRIHGMKVRIPLAGPANRQGRIAAGNALGQKLSYRGSLGTSVVRVFDAVAGSTGLNLMQARKAGLEADAVTVHKEHHTSYFPGSRLVTVQIVYDRKDGRILGGQTAGYAGADKRLDVIATAAAGRMSIHDLADLDLSYAPPIGTANDAINMAAFAAENRMTGYSPSLTAAELDDFLEAYHPALIDVRDYFAFEKSHAAGAEHLPQVNLKARMANLPVDRPLLIYDDHGKKAHQILRELLQNGFKKVFNVSGGYTSLERHARAGAFAHLRIPLLTPESKSLTASSSEKGSAEAAVDKSPLSGSGPVVIDVRTPEEYSYGFYPRAVNVPLDELGPRAEELGEKSRQIIVYCASGARSAYAARMLSQMGFTNVQNGGGLMDMMANIS